MLSNPIRNNKSTTVSVLTFLSACALLSSAAADDYGSALKPVKGKVANAQMGAATASNHLMAFNVSVGGSSVFSPDGKLYATGKQNGSIELRDTQTANLLATMSQLKKPPKPRSAVNWRPFLAFSPDGKVLASASGNSPVTLWDVQQRKKIKTLPVTSEGHYLTFPADGMVETVEDDTPFVRILDVKTGGETVKIQAQDWALSLDGKFVVTRANVDTSGRRHRHRIWNTATGKMIKEIME